jgi:hypothetical protein
VLVHEVGHLVRAHAERADALRPDRDHDCWALACFPPGTLLPHGKRIEHPATMRRHFQGDLVSITTQAGSIDATPDHPFRVRRPGHKVGLHPVRLGDAQWLAASELQLGDYLCVPRIVDKKDDTVIDLRGHIANGADSLGRPVRPNGAMETNPLDVATVEGAGP